MLTDGYYVVVPDMQVPYHDERALERVLKFLDWYRPDGLLCVGDEADAPEISRWEKGKKGEYAGTLLDGLASTFEVIEALTDAAGCGMHLMRSNHTSTRLINYIDRYAPALAGADWLTYDHIMGFNGKPSTLPGHEGESLRVTWHSDIWEFAPGWVLAHGDEGGLSRIPGQTALNLAKRVGASVVCGHTHRAALTHDTQGFAGTVKRVLYGLEVGHLMDTRKVSYLSTAGNWHQGLGLLHIESGKVHPELVLIGQEKFHVWGGTF